jgi:hypothetical protein
MGKLKLPTSLLGTLKVQSIAMFKNSLISLFLIAFLGASVQGQAPGDPPLSNPCVVPWYGLLASAPVYYSPSDQQDIGIVLWVTCDRPNTFGYTQLLSGGQVLGNCSSFTFDSHLTSRGILFAGGLRKPSFYNLPTCFHCCSHATNEDSFFGNIYAVWQ